MSVESPTRDTFAARDEILLDPNSLVQFKPIFRPKSPYRNATELLNFIIQN